ncbi:MAG: isochorismatase family protein [Actinobacteria bacterium]|nr:isochorismatase family protein [Actinomycetota bacterium]
MSQALIVIDAQVNMFEPTPAHDAAPLLQRLEDLVAAARRRQIPIVFVRNNGGEEDPDAPGTPGWEIHPRLAPHPGDLIVDKWGPDAFATEELMGFIERAGVTSVVIAGLQSEYCVSATSRGAARSDLEVVVVEDGHSTFDGDDPAASVIESVNLQLASFGKLRSAADVMADWTLPAA